MVNVCIFYDHLEYFMAIWYNSSPFYIACGLLLYFLDQEKSGNPASYHFFSFMALQFRV
jgi:hypothetical protein